MARPKEIISDELIELARAELSKIEDYKLCTRLQAIVSCEKHALQLVASINGISRVCLWRWIKNFEEQGISGLKDKSKGHNPAKLGEKEQKQITIWLSEGKNRNGEEVHWTLARLKVEIEEVFGIRVGMTPLWRLIRKLGFRQKVPRPKHKEGDPIIQEAFKKKC